MNSMNTKIEYDGISGVKVDGEKYIRSKAYWIFGYGAAFIGLIIGIIIGRLYDEIIKMDLIIYMMIIGILLALIWAISDAYAVSLGYKNFFKMIKDSKK